MASSDSSCLIELRTLDEKILNVPDAAPFGELPPCLLQRPLEKRTGLSQKPRPRLFGYPQTGRSSSSLTACTGHPFSSLGTASRS